MASIPCAAYQASSIHGNLRRQHRIRHHSGTSLEGESGASTPCDTPPGSPVIKTRSFTFTAQAGNLPTLSEEKKTLFGSLTNMDALKRRAHWVWNRSYSHPDVGSAPYAPSPLAAPSPLTAPDIAKTSLATSSTSNVNK